MVLIKQFCKWCLRFLDKCVQLAPAVAFKQTRRPASCSSKKGTGGATSPACRPCLHVCWGAGRPVANIKPHSAQLCGCACLCGGVSVAYSCVHRRSLCRMNSRSSTCRSQCCGSSHTPPATWGTSPQAMKSFSFRTSRCPTSCRPSGEPSASTCVAWQRADLLMCLILKNHPRCHFLWVFTRGEDRTLEVFKVAGDLVGNTFRPNPKVEWLRPGYNSVSGFKFQSGVFVQARRLYYIVLAGCNAATDGPCVFLWNSCSSCTRRLGSRVPWSST